MPSPRLQKWRGHVPRFPYLIAPMNMTKQSTSENDETMSVIKWTSLKELSWQDSLPESLQFERFCVSSFCSYCKLFIFKIPVSGTSFQNTGFLPASTKLAAKYRPSGNLVAEHLFFLRTTMHFSLSVTWLLHLANSKWHLKVHLPAEALFCVPRALHDLKVKNLKFLKFWWRFVIEQRQRIDSPRDGSSGGWIKVWVAWFVKPLTRVNPSKSLTNPGQHFVNRSRTVFRILAESGSV